MLSQGVSGDISELQQRHRRHTSFLPVNVRLNVGLLERPPFEVFPIAAALDLAFGALLASRLLFATFQSFGFASHAACEVIPSVHAQRYLCASAPRPCFVQNAWRNSENIPLRLFDCLGFGGPSLLLGADGFRATGAFFVDCLRAPLATGGWSSREAGRGGLGLRRRKTEGDGM